MGYGDEVMLTGLAKGAALRGKVIGFGDGHQLLCTSAHCEEVFRHNPNIARSAGVHNIEWIHHHRGKRPTFNKTEQDRYVWDYRFKVVPGEFFFDETEKTFMAYRGGILIEPNVEWKKSVAPNKDWGFGNYQRLCDRLLKLGHTVWQMSYGPNRLQGAKVINVPSYRCMAAALKSVDLVVCPEGGMSHAAGAVGAKAVVIFGGFPAVEVVGYDFHKNFTGGLGSCGKFVRCQHCHDAMQRITVDEILEACVA